MAVDLLATAALLVDLLTADLLGGLLFDLLANLGLGLLAGLLLAEAGLLIDFLVNGGLLIGLLAKGGLLLLILAASTSITLNTSRKHPDSSKHSTNSIA